MTTNPIAPIGSSAENASTKKRTSRRKRRVSDEKTATALHYQPGEADIAPVIIAQETGDLAKQLIEIAKKKGVPVKEDADLATLVAAAGVGEEIPIEAFLVIAELFRHLYREENKAPPPVAGKASKYWKGG